MSNFTKLKVLLLDFIVPVLAVYGCSINISPNVVDCIVFWTKNAGNIIPHLDQLKDYKYYFQYTINPYNKLIEENVPLKKDVIENFRSLSEIIGPNRVIWR